MIAARSSTSPSCHRALSAGCSATVRVSAATTNGSGEVPSSPRRASSAVQSTVRKTVTCGMAACRSRLSAIARRVEPASVEPALAGSAVPPPPSAAARTSSAVIRPAGPVPATDARSMPRSFASFRTGGVALTLSPAGASPPSNVTNGAPTGMDPPGAPCSSVTTPAKGEGISTAAFAVSTSTSGWFSATVSPTSTSQATISPSSRPSPRSGIVNTRPPISSSPSPGSPPRCGARWAGSGVPAPPADTARPIP